MAKVHGEAEGKFMNKSICPICEEKFEYRTADDSGKMSLAATFPFCSDRCKFIDLGRWIDEDYRIECKSDQQPAQWLLKEINS